jgi:glucose-1-phosphate cytidylyltransferase
MKTVILAGGLGTRLSEETIIKPKPMVEVGGKPLLLHIMNIYGAFGFKEFVIALGHKQEIIKEYFLNYYYHESDFSIHLNTGKISISKDDIRRDWILHLINTGSKTMTGGRLLRLKKHLETETFMLTYGDGLSSLDINKLIKFHKAHKKIATVTAVRPAARFGGIMVGSNGKISEFKEKPQTGEGWINGGFFVLEPQIFDYLSGDETMLEAEPLENLAKDGQLMAYKHDGFWQCVDTLRDKQKLESMWEKGKPPWKIWPGEY